mmetsp:Transcript_21086/g.27697  ORF Transcript_21086/g.27697 Transcript_21086/m.27697 type:complete len:85 (-) Transcript_21086:1835-2089(-)
MFSCVYPYIYKIEFISLIQLIYAKIKSVVVEWRQSMKWHFQNPLVSFWRFFIPSSILDAIETVLALPDSNKSPPLNTPLVVGFF